MSEPATEISVSLEKTSFKCAILIGAGVMVVTIISWCPSIANSTVVTESSWRQNAAAYRVTGFLCSLVPVSWEKVEQAWTQTSPGIDAGNDLAKSPQWQSVDNMLSFNQPENRYVLGLL